MLMSGVPKAYSGPQPALRTRQAPHLVESPHRPVVRSHRARHGVQAVAATTQQVCKLRLQRECCRPAAAHDVGHSLNLFAITYSCNS